MFAFVEFFDAAFIRLIWGLVVDWLIASGYLLPAQRQLWVDGYVHILSAAGAIVFLAIWMHHSNKKESNQQIQSDVAAITKNPGLFSTILGGLRGFVIKEKTTTTLTADNNPHGITHLPQDEPTI